MGNYLAIIEVMDGAPTKASLATITAAKKAKELLGGGEVIAVVLGEGIGDAAKAVAGCGPDKVIAADNAALKEHLAVAWGPAIAQIAKANDVSHVFGGSTTTGRDILPRVAAELDGGQVSEVVDLAADGGKLQYLRPMYAGSLMGTFTVEADVALATVRATGFSPAEPGQGDAPVENADVSVSVEGTTFVNYDQVKSDRPALTDANVVVAGGRALKDADNFASQLEPLADQMKAAIGASRAAVDSGYCANDLQVGQTGKIVAPSLYFAVGISGAIQHIAGMKDSKVIVAVNKDPEAPIFQYADYGIVADLFKVMPELTDKIKAAMA